MLFTVWKLKSTLSVFFYLGEKLQFKELEQKEKWPTMDITQDCVTGLLAQSLSTHTTFGAGFFFCTWAGPFERFGATAAWGRLWSEGGWFLLKFGGSREGWCALWGLRAGPGPRCPCRGLLYWEGTKDKSVSQVSELRRFSVSQGSAGFLFHMKVKELPNQWRVRCQGAFVVDTWYFFRNFQNHEFAFKAPKKW